MSEEIQPQQAVSRAASGLLGGPQPLPDRRIRHSQREVGRPDLLQGLRAHEEVVSLQTSPLPDRRLGQGGGSLQLGQRQHDLLVAAVGRPQHQVRAAPAQPVAAAEDGYVRHPHRHAAHLQEPLHDFLPTMETQEGERWEGDGESESRKGIESRRGQGRRGQDVITWLWA